MVDPDDRDDEGLSMQDLVEGLLSHYATPRTPAMLSANVFWRPATDVYETDHSIVIRMDVAGMRRESFEIVVDGGDLLIRGHRKDPTPAGKKHFHKMEINVGPFERRIRIPVPFDPSKVAASYDNGFLEVRIGKTSKPPPKRIRVEIE
jgi:HSP20 family protein